MGRIDTLMETYSDVPRSVVLRYELNRLGVAAGQSVLKAVQDLDICFKGEFMFSWDGTARKKLEQKVPWCYHLVRDDTLFLNRTNDHSPYVMECLDGKFFLCEDGQPFEEIQFAPRPEFYSRKTSDGIPMSQIVTPIGDQLFVTLNKYCEYFKDGEQCLFCDLTPTGVDQAKIGETASLHRTSQQVVEALEAAFSEIKPRSYRHLMISGGTILKTYKGQTDLDYYVSSLEAIANGLKRWYPATIQIGPPKDKEGWKRLKDTGIASIEPNLEVMDKDKFKILCPGKAKHIGHDEWIRRMIEGAEVFGPGRIIPNFVIGAEMAKPFGFTDIDEAVEAGLKGYGFLMENGVLPRFAVWFIESKSALAGQEPAPLEYYIKLGKGYKKLRDKYGFHDLICGCRGCWVQDAIYDWDYAERKEQEKQAVLS